MSKFLTTSETPNFERAKMSEVVPSINECRSCKADSARLCSTGASWCVVCMRCGQRTLSLFKKAAAIESWNTINTVQSTEPVPVFQAPGHPAQVEIVPGALSTPCPKYYLIPKIVLDELTGRFELGEERKGDKAWNAFSNNQDILKSKEFLLERLSHVVAHCFKLMAKISAEDVKALREDNDASAICWGGAYAICSRAAIIAESELKDAARNV